MVGILVGRSLGLNRIVPFPSNENTGSRDYDRRTTLQAMAPDRLDRIESSLAISQLPSRYARALDARDVAAFTMQA